MFRTAVWVSMICIFLGGCMTSQEATERVRAEAMACAAGKKTQVKRVKCGIDAENRYLAPRYPDLVYLVHTQAAALALQVDRGELTRRQAEARLMRIQAQVAKEKRRRATSFIWKTPKLSIYPHHGSNS